MARKAAESRAEAGRDPPRCLEKEPALPTPSRGLLASRLWEEISAV